MTGKKVLISSVLSLSLLISVAPASASSIEVTPVKQSNITPQVIHELKLPNSINAFDPVIEVNGRKWYLKKIEYSAGTYYGIYQANF